MKPHPPNHELIVGKGKNRDLSRLTWGYFDTRESPLLVKEFYPVLFEKNCYVFLIRSGKRVANVVNYSRNGRISNYGRL
jgi:hypothetical protein